MPAMPAMDASSGLCGARSAAGATSGGAGKARRSVLPLAVRNPQALFDPSNRKPPMYIARDSIRRGEMLGRPVVLPADPDPIVQDFRTMQVASEQPYIYRLSKLGVEANRRGRGVEFADRVAALIFGGTRGWNQGDLLDDAVADAGLNLAALDAAWDLVKGWSIEEQQALRDTVPSEGLDAPAPGGGTVGQLAHRVLDIAAAGLAARGEVNSMGDNEVGFLEPLRRIAKSGKSPAHDLLDRYEGPWGGDLSKIYDELSF